LLVGLVLLSGGPHPAAARDQSFRGSQIDLLQTAPLSLPAAEPSFVSNGWAFPLLQDTEVEPAWKNISPEGRLERRESDIWRFELFVDGVQVPLQRSFHAGFTPPLVGVALLRLHYVQFEPGAFTPGTYAFRGVWHSDFDDDDVEEIFLDQTRTVTFTGQ